jgi:hypothetical protein
MNFYCICIFLLLIIFFCLYSSSQNTQENFTPAIRRMYRPYVRSARIYSESFFKDSNNSINSFLRKVGLY